MVTFTIDNSDEVNLARCLGVKDLAYTTRIPGGGAAAAATIYQAMAMVNAGLCNNVLIWRAMNERSQYRFGQNPQQQQMRSEEHTSELQSLMRTSYAVFCLKKKNIK